MSTSESFDLVVIGGGPSGSTLAAFVAMQGHRVLLIEREHFPRYQIGESLLPSTVHGICALLGVSDQVAAAGFQRKNGGCFRWGKSQDVWTFNFRSSSALNDANGYAYQVERSKFDAILFENARKKGVEIRQSCRVVSLSQTDGRYDGVEYVDEYDVRHQVTARFVADASGNTSRIYKHAGERIFSKYFQNVALFGYFENGKRLPPPSQGNILCAAFDQGWFWYIPLSPTLTSVGAVVARSEAEVIAGDPEAAMRNFIAACPLIASYLEGATRVTEGQYGQLRVRKDYSYCNTRFWVPGLVLVGDAACFIDPVFSSGVHLATYSALLAARSVNTVLRGGIDEAACFEEFERRYRREFSNFYEFLVYFYDMNQNEASYFWRARSVLRTDERANEAFVRLVAGTSSPDEFFDARQGKAERIQAATDTTPSADPGDLVKPHWDQDDLIHDFHRETEQIQEQAMLGATRAPEEPLFATGLIPSRDGFFWTVK